MNGSAGWRCGGWRACLLLSGLVFGLYAISLPAFFVGDDYDHLLKALWQAGWTDAVRMTFWGAWGPVWYLSWYLDYRWWGLNPLGYHLTNTLLLATAVVTLFGLVRKLWPGAPLAAWAAALLFASHPLHDEAIIYLAARGHPLAALLGLLTLLAYVQSRMRDDRGPAFRGALLAAALALSLLAALAKEVALSIPAWIAALEWSLPREPRSRPAWLRAAGAGSLFLCAAVASQGLRFWVVGFESNKLRGVAGDLEALAKRLVEELPIYALMGSLPLPFGSVDYQTLQRWSPLGWLLVASALLGGAAALRRVARRSHGFSPVAGLCVLGVVIALSSLAPLLWADLPLRRRYLYAPSIGIVLVAAALLQALARRQRRAAWALLAVLVAGGAAVTVQRNLLYLRSGAVARDLIETARQAPLGESAGWVSGPLPRIALTTLPRAYGGDFVSGAYLLHETDLHSALILFGVPQPRIDAALKCYYADDYYAAAAIEGPARLRLTVRFRSAAAFAAAAERDPRADREGRLLSAKLRSADPDSRTLIYDLRPHASFWSAPSGMILVYSAAGVRRIPLAELPRGPLVLKRPS
ncbi:MAG TPA: hypothetical protein VGB99_08375 [Acidobacteriota bacterium]